MNDRGFPLALSLLLASALMLVGCTSAPASSDKPKAPAESPPELTVSAATSLKGAFEELGPLFTKESGAKLVMNFGASGQLARQIEAGAPVDVFASASPKQMDELIADGLVAAESTSTFAGNELVIVVPAGNPKDVTGPEDLGRLSRLTTGDPTTAPHGTKAKEWLEKTGRWRVLARKFVFAENAAQTVDYVARGEVDAGIAFASEIGGRDDVAAVYTVPLTATGPIRYVAAPTLDSDETELAASFVEFLSSRRAQAVLARHQFKAAPR